MSCSTSEMRREKISRVESLNTLVSVLEQMTHDFGVIGIFVLNIPSYCSHLSEYIRLRSGIDGWINEYIDNDYFHNDLIVRAARVARKPFIWSELLAISNPSTEQLKLIDKARIAGIVDGFTIPFHGPLLELCTVNYATNGTKLDHETRQLLEEIAREAVSKLDEIAGYRDIGTIPVEFESSFSRQELETIYWVMHGMLSKEIAFLLGVSVRTVEAYIASAMKKLNASNRAELVRIALLNGILPLTQD